VFIKGPAGCQPKKMRKENTSVRASFLLSDRAHPARGFTFAQAMTKNSLPK